MCNDQALCDLLSSQHAELSALILDQQDLLTTINQEVGAASAVVQYAFYAVPICLFFWAVYKFLKGFMI